MSLPENIRLGWAGMAETNNLVYYDTTTNMPVKSFIVQAPWLNVTQNYIRNLLNFIIS
jgi:hypothetical protein